MKDLDYYRLGYADGRNYCERGFDYDDEYIRGYWDDENDTIDNEEYARGYEEGWDDEKAKERTEDERDE